MITELQSNFLFYAFLINLLFWGCSAFVAVVVHKVPLYHPIFIYHLYHFVGFVCRPYMIWSNQQSTIWIRTGITPSFEDLILTTVTCNLALVAVMAGFLYVNGRDRKVPMIAPFQIQVGKPMGLVVAVVLLAGMGIYSTFKSYGGTGLKSVMAYKVKIDENGGQQLQDVSGYMTALAEFLPIVCIVLFAVPRTRKLSYFAITSFVMLRMYCGAQRLSFVVVIAAILFMSLVMARRRFPPVKVLALIAAFAVIFDVIGNDRYAFRRIIYGEATLSETVSRYSEGRGSQGLTSDVVEYDVASSVLSLVPSQTGWSYGSQYIRLLVWPIPRQLWADKPVTTTNINLNKYGNFFGLTYGLYADAYMVIGIPGMILILFGIGAYLTYLYKLAVDTKNITVFLLFWSQTIYLQTLFRDGGVTVVYFVGFSMVAVVVLCRLGGLRLCRQLSS